MPRQTNSHFPKRRPSRLVSFTILATWLLLLVAIGLNRQNIFDWWKLRSYQAPVSISALASQDTMTDKARRIFYVNKPQIENKSSFAKSCPNSSKEQSIVLGCYHSDQDGIFLLGVSDERLNGVEQVTAAHEMLHAAYDRLSSSERQRVNSLLEDYYKNQLKDPRILKTIDDYKRTEPKDVVNEMHSIFGTEVANLPSQLETYYQRYFSDRSKVAAYAAKYQAEFSSRQAIVDNADSQLAVLKSEIETNETELNSKQSTIDSQRQKLVSLRNDGSLAAYNAGVPIYNNLVDGYNRQVQTIRSLIARYNQLVERRNAVALEEDQLVNALSSSDVAPINQ